MFAAAAPLSFASVALGLGAVGVLFALHCLRARPVRRAVATLIFWRETPRERSTRALWSRRFSHLPTFLLLSLIALLVAASLSADRWGRGDGERVLVVVDVGSPMAAMGEGGRTLLQDAVVSAESDAERLGSTPTLVAAAARPTIVSEAGVPLRVWKDRLSRLTSLPEASNALSAIELAASLLGDQTGRIDWYTDRPALPEGLPAEVARRVRLRTCRPPAEGLAVVGVQFEPGDGSGSTGALRVQLAGRLAGPVTLKATVGGVVREASVGPVDGRAILRFDKVPAEGQTAIVDLPGVAGSPVEHTVSFRLPKRPPLQFCVIGEIPRPLRDALSAIGTETRSPKGCIVAGSQGQTVPAGATGEVMIVDAKPSSGAGQLIALAGADTQALEGIDFEGATAAAGRGIPASARPLLVAGSEAVAGLERTPAGPRLYLSTAVVGDTTDLPRRAAFPVLIGRLMSELDGWQEAEAVVPVRRLAEDPLWPGQPTTPPNTTAVFEAPVLAVADKPAVAVPSASVDTGVNWRWSEILLLGGLVLLVVEALLLAKKKII